LDYLIPGMLGFLTGAILYGLTYSTVFPKISEIANFGSTVLPDLWNISAGLAVVFFALLSVFLFYLIDRVGMHRNEKSS
jgi:uncharacterized protein